MAKRIVLEGTVEKKFKHVEIFLNRMLRRLHRRVITIMPPIPISFYRDSVPEDGIIFKWLCPANATLTAASLFVGEYEEKPQVEFGIAQAGNQTGNIFTFKTRKELSNIKVDMPLHGGDRITFRCTEPERVKNIWVSFLIAFDTEHAVKGGYLLDEFLKDVEKETEEITEGNV